MAKLKDVDDVKKLRTTKEHDHFGDKTKAALYERWSKLNH
jgi:hypothetical protein